MGWGTARQCHPHTHPCGTSPLPTGPQEPLGWEPLRCHQAAVRTRDSPPTQSFVRGTTPTPGTPDAPCPGPKYPPRQQCAAACVQQLAGVALSPNATGAPKGRGPASPNASFLFAFDSWPKFPRVSAERSQSRSKVSDRHVGRGRDRDGRRPQRGGVCVAGRPVG